ncbi:MULTISPECIES: hypothetical protein [unclassified Frankia]|uniref:hypothetical protein n=1 Tax=unclassified Frankia TaxID=2632575 RepID=UPI002AD503F5|nr:MULTISPECIES: hypothetical protein [unclassified Frankia]
MTGALRTALARGDGAAVDTLMNTDHALAVLLAEAVGACPEAVAVVAVVERAWLDTVAVVVADPDPPVRVALLGAVLRLMREDGQLDDAAATADSATARSPEPEPEPSRAGFFLPPDDRWAGWWNVDVPSWPAGWVPTAEQVRHAVRRLALNQRTLLILRDAAKLSATEAAPITGTEPDDQGRLLDSAREAYVAYLDEECRAVDSGAERR